MARSLILALILSILLARSAWAEEPDASPENLDPAQVGRLLLSDEEDERARGAALLRARMAQGGDVQTWLVAMARAQAAWADADERLVERWIDDVLRGTPERAEKARRLLAAMGREATRRLLQALKDVQQLLPQQAGQVREPGTATPQLPVLPMPETFEPPPPPQTAELPEPAPVAPAPPRGWIEARVLEVPTVEVLRSLAVAGDARAPGGAELAPLAHDEAVVVPAQGLFELAAALPEARVRVPAPSLGLLGPGRDLVLLQGDPVRYRSRARRTKGAWAVETDTLRRGVGVRVRLVTEGPTEGVEVEARYTSVPDPLPTEQVRPANDVEPLELDRPEWQTASMRLRTTTAEASNGVVAFFPGLVPDKVLVVGLRLRTVPPQAAAREQGK